MLTPAVSWIDFHYPLLDYMALTSDCHRTHITGVEFICYTDAVALYLYIFVMKCDVNRQ